MPKRYPAEQRERAVKMVLDHLAEYRSLYAACQSIGPKLGIGAESLRQWTRQAMIDADQAPGVTSEEQMRIKGLEREVRDLKEANERHCQVVWCAVVFGHSRPSHRAVGQSFREIELMMAERGIEVTYETMRTWCARFGPEYARRLRRHQPQTGDRWHLDEALSS